MRDVLWLRAIRSVLATTAVLTWAASASAQSLPEPGTWSVTPVLQTSMGMGDPAPENSIGIGAGVSYDLTSNLAFEGEIGHLFDTANDDANIDLSVSTFTANALWHVRTPHVTPYAAFGLGVERNGFEVKNPDVLGLYQDLSATEFVVSLGGGVKYALSNRWQARADLRRFQANDLAPDHWRLHGGLSYRVR